MILGLILICILIYQIYFMNNDLEAFISTAKQIKAQNQFDYLKKQNKYYGIRKGGGKAGLLHTKPGINTWYKLDNDKNLKQFNPLGLERTHIDKGVQNCRQITTCSQLNNGKCGYCAYDKEFRYGDKNGPKADVCPKKAWTTDASECEKIREQEICSNVDSCGDLYGEAANICGFCPTTGKAMPMKKVGNKFLPKYPDDTCNAEGYGLLPADKCAKFLKNHPCITPYHSSGPHTVPCIKKLWKNSKCTNPKPYYKSFDTLAKTLKKGYRVIGTQMQNTNTKTRDNVYNVAVQYSNICFGNHNNVDPCDRKFFRNGIPHPECLKKEYLNSGCTKKGTGWKDLQNMSGTKKHIGEISEYKTGADAAVNAVWHGWSEGSRKGKIKKGHGDCDNDKDCAPGLKCGHGENTKSLPGIKNVSQHLRYGRDFCYKPNDTTDINEYKNTMKKVFDLTVGAQKYKTRKHTSEICFGEIPSPPPPMKPGDTVTHNNGGFNYTGIIITIKGEYCNVMWIKSENVTVIKRDGMDINEQKKIFGWPDIPPTHRTVKTKVHKRQLNQNKICSHNKATCKMTCKDIVADVLYRFPFPKDCVVSQWSGYSKCSKKCGSGWQNRWRKIFYPSKFGGKPCPTLRTWRRCNTKPCLNPNFTNNTSQTTTTTLIGNNWTRPRKGFRLSSSLPLYESYEVTFSVIPRSRKSGWRNLFHFGVSGRNVPRIPAVWFYHNSTRLHIRTSANRNNNDGYDPNIHLPLNKVTNVTIKVTGHYVSIGMSGAVRGYWRKWIGGHSLKWGRQGQAWFGSRHYNAADVQIKNLTYQKR